MTTPHSKWQIRTHALSFGDIPLLMGIVNVTPDSFSDGGQFLNKGSIDHAKAIDHALQLVAEGADILDIGGESTRPGADSVSEREELRRVIPVVQGICSQTDVPVSIDTSKALVARAAIEAGAEIINDVSGLESDPQMPSVARKTKAGVCAMHMQGNPRTMQDDPQYGNVVEDVFHYLAVRRDTLVAMGVEPSRICLDPGIGFGKTQRHNLELMTHCERFLALDCPILVGHSRKGFLAKVLGDEDAGRRVTATVAASLALARKQVHVLRVHDVRAVRDALVTFAATGGLG